MDQTKQLIDLIVKIIGCPTYTARNRDSKIGYPQMQRQQNEERSWCKTDQTIYSTM